MTWALQWSATGDLVERDGAPLLFADDIAAAEHYRKHFKFLEQSPMQLSKGIPLAVRVAVLIEGDIANAEK